jgi:eukaryotic-like serine/threonine-protein kinase
LRGEMPPPAHDAPLAAASHGQEPFTLHGEARVPPPLVATGASVTAGPSSPPTSATRVASPSPTDPTRVAVVPAASPAAQSPARKRRSRRRLAVAVAIVLVAAAVAGVALYAFASRGVPVPQVVGKSEAQARAAVRDAGLDPVTHRAYYDGVSGGVVARQRPGRGELDKGEKVDIWVSRGPLHIPAPDVKGLTPGEAREALADADLAGAQRKARSTTVAEGLVARQQPKAGTTVARGDTVIYWVSIGPPLVEVPDVVGLSSSDAAGVLEDAGFTVNVDLVAGLGEYPGDVVDQDPAAGHKLESSSEVTIKVAIF